jgi:hypothetical protein
MSARRLSHSLLTVTAAASLAAGTPPAIAQEDRPPFRLWSEYPLDPTQTKGFPPAATRSQKPTSITKERARPGRVGPREATEPEDTVWDLDPTSPWLLLPAGALVLALALVSKGLVAGLLSGPGSPPARAAGANGRSTWRARPQTSAAEESVPHKLHTPAQEVAAAGSAGARDRSVARPVVSPHAELCVIGWSRGYVKSQFYALARSKGGRRYVVAVSPMFWWRGADSPPPTEGPLGAHTSLLEELRRQGWEPVGERTAAAWYATILRRRAPASLRALTVVLNKRRRAT